MTTIDKLEAHLQSLLENHLLRILPGHKPEDHLAQRLATAMYTNLKDLNGSSVAPNLYVIVAHPGTLTAWNSKIEQLETLTDALRETAEEAGLTFAVRPKISTSSDAGMDPGELRVVASFRDGDLIETRDMPVANAPTHSPDMPSNAFLVLQGTDIIPLTESVINIGRRLDNQVVIDDPRVSRNHAQMRVIKGRFVIFDLESTGGVYVNGQRTNQSVLYPGDVISVAGVTLVFGQDIPAGRKSSQDQPNSMVSADRPTVIFKRDKEDKE